MAWPKGKPRTTLAPPARKTTLTMLKNMTKLRSVRSIAATLGVSDRSIRRILSGEDQPSERMYRLVLSLRARPQKRIPRAALYRKKGSWVTVSTKERAWTSDRNDKNE